MMIVHCPDAFVDPGVTNFPPVIAPFAPRLFAMLSLITVFVIGVQLFRPLSLAASP